MASDSAPTAMNSVDDTSDLRYAGNTARKTYLDNLKVILVIGVIVTHAAIACQRYWVWPYKDPGTPGVVTAVLGIGGALGILFWLGTFFLVAGMLTSHSLARKGARRYLADRLARLGVPLAVFALLVMPVLDYISYVAAYHGPGSPRPVWQFVLQRASSPSPGQVWFVTPLLLCAALYVGWSLIRRRDSAPLSSLGVRHLIAAIVTITVLTFAARLVWPLDSRQFFALHLWQWPQYFVLFWFGATAAERGWLNGLSDRGWHWCCAVALAALGITACVVLAAVILETGIAGQSETFSGGWVGGSLAVQMEPFRGGWHWQAFAAAALEGIVSVSASLFVLELFRRHFGRERALGRAMARSAYGAFFAQGPVLTGLGLIIGAAGLPVGLQLLLLLPAAVIASFGLAWLAVMLRSRSRRPRLRSGDTNPRDPLSHSHSAAG